MFVWGALLRFTTITLVLFRAFANMKEKTRRALSLSLDVFCIV